MVYFPIRFVCCLTGLSTSHCMWAFMFCLHVLMVCFLICQFLVFVFPIVFCCSVWSWDGLLPRRVVRFSCLLLFYICGIVSRIFLEADVMRMLKDKHCNELVTRLSNWLLGWPIKKKQASILGDFIMLKITVNTLPLASLSLLLGTPKKRWTSSWLALVCQPW